MRMWLLTMSAPLNASMPPALEHPDGQISRRSQIEIVQFWLSPP
jgi:hypothetical protein